MRSNLSIADSPALNLKGEEVKVFEAAGGSFDSARIYIEGGSDLDRGGNVGEVAAGSNFVEIEPEGVLCARKVARSYRLKELDWDLNSRLNNLGVANRGCFLHTFLKFLFVSTALCANRGGFVFLPYNERDLLHRQDAPPKIATHALYIINLAIAATLMKSYEAFDQTAVNFKITNVWFAEKAGVSESSISRFRRGKQNLSTDDLDVLLATLSEEERQFYYSLLLGDIGDNAIASMLYALSVKLRDGAQARAFEAEKIPA